MWPSLAFLTPPLRILTMYASNSTNSRLNLSTKSDSRDNHDHPSAKRFNPVTGNGKGNPFSPAAIASPTSAGGSSAFGLGGGAFSFGSSAKTPKTPGATFDLGRPNGDKRDTSEDEKKDSRRPPAPRKSHSNFTASGEATAEHAAPYSKSQIAESPLKDAWVIYIRPPTGKNSDYEKSIQPMCKMQTVQDFWKVYAHLHKPSALPTVSDYHFFKAGIRPVWEDDNNKKGGKWTMRLKKGVADRYWEDLLMALVGDQFFEASEEVCGAVVSVRSGEDVISVWTKNDGGRNVKIRETIKRVLSLPADTHLVWRSHDESIVQKDQVDKARQEKRRNTMSADKKDDEDRT